METETATEKQSEKYWRWLFDAGVLLRILNGIWETVVGSALLIFSATTLTNTFITLSQRELFEDPNDRLLSLGSNWIQHMSAYTKDFAGAYILFHGALNIFLAYQLARNRLWAYPTSIVLVALSVLYQTYRITHTHSIILTLVTALDVFFIVTTIHEYRYRKGTVTYAQSHP